MHVVGFTIEIVLENLTVVLTFCQKRVAVMLAYIDTGDDANI